jgi:hypothetical protein
MTTPPTDAAPTPTLARFGFSGHETFVFRYGWLKKGLDAAADNPSIFTQENALVELGVGKNMVSSIRHWCLATKLLTEASGELKLSEIGEKLFKDWDPFLEDTASLWLIHWLLINNFERAGLWHLAFKVLVSPDFTKEELTELGDKFAKENKIRANKNTIERDVDIFIRTYLPSRNTKGFAEEGFDCPLVELGLLQQTKNSERYRFSIGAKPNLPIELFCFALLDFIARADSARRTWTLHDCVYGTASPGQVFKLTENAVVEYLEQIGHLTQGAVVFDETEGLRQVYLQRPIEALGMLERYYGGI